MSTPIKPPDGPKGAQTPEVDASDAPDAPEGAFADAVARTDTAEVRPESIDELATAVREGSINKDTVIEDLLARSGELAARLGLDDVEGLRTFLEDAIEHDPTLRALVEDLSG